ncbi:holin, partial [Streptomyces lydicus]
DESHGNPTPCGQRSAHADHYPLSRRELVARGDDPDDPRHGRGLCGPCHSSETAQHQPGGWNQ